MGKGVLAVVPMLAILIACAPKAAAALSPSCTPPYTYQCGKAPAVSNYTYAYAPNTIDPTKPQVQLMLDVYLPQSFGVTPTGAGVVVVHGGGWVGGDKSAMQFISNDLAAHGFITYNIDYRLAPSANTSYYANTGRYTDLVQDVQSAVLFARKYTTKLGGSATPKIGVVGGSAGGHLADMVAVSGIPGSTRVDAAVDLSGPGEIRLDQWIDTSTGQPISDSDAVGQLADNFVGCPYYFTTSPSACPSNFAVVSPSTQVSSSTAPTLVVAATQDPTVMPGVVYPSTHLYYQDLKAAGGTTFFDTPTNTTCHAGACWDTTTVETGHYVAADSIWWLHHFLNG